MKMLLSLSKIIKTGINVFKINLSDYKNKKVHVLL